MKRRPSPWRMLSGGNVITFRLLRLFTCVFIFNSSSLADTASGNNGQNIGQGAFSVRILSLQHLLYPGSSHYPLNDLQKDDIRIGISIGHGNVWNNKTGYYIMDGEWTHVDFRFSLALSDKLEAGFILPVTSRNGGFLDSTIESFHNRLGFKNQGRENAPRNDIRVEYFKNGGSSISITDSSTGLSDIPVFVAWHITRGDNVMPAIILQPRITIPVGDRDQLEGLGKVTYGLAGIASKRIGKTDHLIFLIADSAYCSVDHIEQLELRNYFFTGTLGWEYQWSTKTSLLAQYSVSSGIVSKSKEWSDDAHHLNIGIKRRIAERTVLEFSIQENLFHYNNSADVGVHLALTHIF
ncbi:MAG TPA: DUF3187 family protein [Kiritimatiellia bacterium]|nr:DUF3187 family protein [Kiritimatiellia bacterium]